MQWTVTVVSKPDVARDLEMVGVSGAETWTVRRTDRKRRTRNLKVPPPTRPGRGSAVPKTDRVGDRGAGRQNSTRSEWSYHGAVSGDDCYWYRHGHKHFGSHPGRRDRKSVLHRLDPGLESRLVYQTSTSRLLVRARF